MTETFKTTNPNIITHDNVPLGSKPAGAIKVPVANIDNPATELSAYSGSAGSLLLAYSGEECTEYMWVSSATPNVPLIVAGSTGYWVAFSGGVVTDPGGSDTHVQYNDGGAFGGKSTFTFDPDTNTLTVIGTTSLKADAGYEPSLWVSPSGRLAYGFSTGTPTYAFSFVGTGGQSIGMERNTSADAGQEFVIAAGAAKSGASNAAGGTLRLKGGTSTGSGVSAVEIWTAAAGSSGTTDRAAALRATVDANGVNVPTGATYNINNTPHSHTAFADITMEDLLLATAYQPSITFWDSNAGGPAGQHKAKILYDSGVEISSIGGWVIQDISDAGAFVANRITIWKDGSVHFGGITRPDAAGGIHISSGKLEVAGYNIETNQQVVSTVATGTVPFAPTSTTMCPNLNANYVGGQSIYNLCDSLGWTTETYYTWVYVSATSFKIEDIDVTSIFPPGTRVAIYQSSWKYFFVVSASYAASDTTVTVFAGSDFSIANATITGAKFSYSMNPRGYPFFFEYAAPWGGFSSDPSGGVRVACIGNLGIMQINPAGYGTSDDTTTTLTLPMNTSSAMDNANQFWGIGVDNGSALTVACRARVVNSSTSVELYNGFNGAWTGSGDKVWRGTIMWEF